MHRTTRTIQSLRGDNGGLSTLYSTRFEDDGSVTLSADYFGLINVSVNSVLNETSILTCNRRHAQG